MIHGVRKELVFPLSVPLFLFGLISRLFVSAPGHRDVGDERKEPEYPAKPGGVYLPPRHYNLPRMPIWKLEPIASATYNPAWAISNWYAPAIVRAKNPGAARRIAAKAFRQADRGKLKMRQLFLLSPWMGESLVTCRQLPVSPDAMEGPDQVLTPLLIEYSRG